MPVSEGRSPSRDRLALLLLASLSLTIFFALLATGGFQTTVLGTRVSARSPVAAGVTTMILLAAWLVLAHRRDAVVSDLAALAAWLDTRARTIVLFIAVLAASVAIAFGTFSAAGSDASGYFSQAAMLGRGALTEGEPLAAVATWRDAPTTLAPLGWRAAAATTIQVPTYAVGLPLLMMIPHKIGGAIAASLVVSVSAGIAIWFAARLAMLLGGGTAGVLVAAWLATMPVFLFESLQPMSDVPVTAAWLAVWWWIAHSARTSSGRVAEFAEKGTVPFSAIFAGLAGGAAVLIRPNLAPLALMPFLFLMMRGTRVAVASFAAFIAASGVAIAYLQWRYFGSPLRSGYGSASEIYSLANVLPNARLYFAWLLDTHGPWLLLAPLVLIVARDALLRWLLAFAGLLCFAYFIYAVFEHWSYLRFLLPAMAIAAIAVSVLAARMTGKLPPAARAPVLVAIAVMISAWQVSTARELGVFRFAARQSRAVLAGRYLASALPHNAVVVTGEESGSVRYYTGRPIVRWDLLRPSDLPLVTNELTAAGYEIWIALDDFEEPLYREKFPRSIAAALDWPPLLEAGTDARTRAWRLRDRAEFMNGTKIPLDRLR